MKIKHIAAIICLGIMSTNSVLGIHAMGKVDPSKVVNGASAPKQGFSGAADRAGKLAGSTAVVAGHAAGGAVKEAVKETAQNVGAAVIGSALLTGQVEVPAVIVVGSAAVGGTIGAVKGCKSGAEAAKYPQQ